MSEAGDARGPSSATGSSKQRRRKKGSSKQKTSSSCFPSDIVCLERDLKRSKKSTELALLLGLTVVALYLFGFVELMKSMPELSYRIKHYQMGGNLNIARMETDSGVDNSIGSEKEATDDDDNDGAEEKPRKKKSKKHRPVIKKEAAKQKDSDSIAIPVGTWPVSVRDEEQETMVHVGDMKTIMKVPKFWSPPVHNNKQYTREQAMKIGTCAEPDPVTGSSVRGENCPIDQRTIYIGIASYRDYQCRLTLESAFKRAANPKRVRVGVVDQIVVGEDVACNEPVKPCEEDPEQVRNQTRFEIKLGRIAE